jgi:hypothetical protein
MISKIENLYFKILGIGMTSRASCDMISKIEDLYFKSLGIRMTPRAKLRGRRCILLYENLYHLLYVYTHTSGVEAQTALPVHRSPGPVSAAQLPNEYNTSARPATGRPSSVSAAQLQPRILPSTPPWSLISLTQDFSEKKKDQPPARRLQHCGQRRGDTDA